MSARDHDDFDGGAEAIGEPETAADAISFRGPDTHGADTFTATDICEVEQPDIDPALSRTIQSEIIPRLLMAHRARTATVAVVNDKGVASDDVVHLVMLTLRDPLSAAKAFVDGVLARGCTVETIVGEFLPAAARHVGWMWETDACTFVDVTCSLTRLQQLLRQYAPSLSVDVPRVGEGRRLLLSSMPGEQHTFGMAVAEEFFRQAAWDVLPQIPTKPSALIACVRTEWFDVIGLSASGDSSFDAMSTLIRGIRSASCNQSIRVIVGGPAIVRNLELAGSVGADAVAHNAHDGIEKMEWMMQALRQPC